MFIDDLRKHLLKSEFATDKTTVRSGFINNLICPECGRSDAYTYEKLPWSIICNRQNKCGARTKTATLFNLGTQVETKYPATKEDKHRPAKAFLESRGIPVSIIEACGCEYHAHTRKGCGGGVMFPVGKDDTGGTLFNGRLFNPPTGEGKTHNVGAVAGHHWQMPGMTYDPEKPTYVTEGIIDALSLIAMGFQAIAVLGAGYDPARFNLAAFGNLAFAFDNDTAGGSFTKKWMKHYQSEPEEEGVPVVKVSAIMPVSGDWNDLLLNAGSPEKAAEQFNRNSKRYDLQARLALAETASSYATIYASGNNCFAPGLFPFKGQYYWSWVKAAKNEGEKPDVFVERASNFTVTVEHYQRSDADEELPVFLYRLKVIPKQGKPVVITANGNDLKSADGLTGLFLRHGKTHWRGNIEASKAFAEMIVESRAPIVRQAAFTGYDHKTGFYILTDFAIDKKGQKVLPGANGFFAVGQGEYLRPALIETINPGACDMKKLYSLLLAAWEENAAVAVAFLVASMFVNQVKKTTKFFPFLSMWGDPQVGKTRLMMILNAMQCLDEEGLPMSGSNTKKGELRALAQVSGHMKGLIEGNDKDKAKFDFESILPLYNYGNALQTRAQTTNDNRIHKLPFHGSLAFAQNKEPFTSRAAKERVISLKFSLEGLSKTTKEAFDALVAIPIQELAGFYPAVMAGRVFFGANWKEFFERSKDDLRADVADNRINENHALILAFHRLLCQHF
jgi:hypothetical protein